METTIINKHSNKSLGRYLKRHLSRVPMITIFCLFLAQSQEREINKAYQIFEKNPAEAGLYIKSATQAIDNKGEMVTPPLYVKYLYIQGMDELNTKNYKKSVEYLQQLKNYEEETIYHGRDSKTNKTIYQTNKDLLLSRVKGKIKSTELHTTYFLKAKIDIINALEKSITLANNDYKAKKYNIAAKEFEDSYYLASLLNDNKANDYLYRASEIYYSIKNINKALEGYEILIKKNYRGENSQTEKALYKSATYCLIKKNEYKKAKELIDKLWVIYPNDRDVNELLLITAKGLKDKKLYIEQLEWFIAKDPNNYKAYYQLANIYSKDPYEQESARQYYEKVINLRADYTDAYLGVAALILKDSSKLESQIKNANSPLESKRLIQEQQSRYKEALPYLQNAYALDRTNKKIEKILNELNSKIKKY